MAQTKLISIRVDEEILDYIDSLVSSNRYVSRSYYVNSILEFGVALMQQGNSNIIYEYRHRRGDRIEIHDYDIIKGDWSNSKNK